MRDFWAPSGSCPNEEELAFVLVYPRHFPKEEFEPTALLSSKQLEEGSLSGVRLRWTSPSEMQKEIMGPAIAKNPVARPDGVAVGKIAEIEDIKDEAGNSAFRVEIDGKRTMPGHIHLGYTGGKSNPARRSARIELVDVLWLRSKCSLMPQLCTVCSWIYGNSASHSIPSNAPIS